MAAVRDAHAYTAQGLLIDQRDLLPSSCDGARYYLARALHVHANGENYMQLSKVDL